MNKNQKSRFWFYLLLSFIGLISAWYYNALAVIAKEDYLAAWGASPATNVLTWDLMITAVAGAVFIFVESKLIGMKRPWLYLLLSGITAMAFVFPLYLAMRERHLAKTSK